MTSPEHGNGLHPRITAEQVEFQSQEIIEDVQIAAQVWELKINEAVALGMDRDDLVTIVSDAVADLDKIWPYHGEAFLVSGKWTRPSFGVSGEDQGEPGEFDSAGSVSWNDIEEDVFEIQHSCGWGYKEIDQKMRFGYVFTAPQRSMSRSYFTMSISSLGFALPEEVSLTTMPTPNKQQGKVYGERVYETLELNDRLMHMYTSRDEFFRLSHKKQLKLIKDVVDDVNTIVTSPGADVRVECDVSEWYQKVEPSTPYGFQRYDVLAQNQGEGICIYGKLHGVAMLEQAALQDKPLRIDEDFVDKQAGLCLIVEVPTLGGSETIYIPYVSTNLKPKSIKIQSD